MGRRDFLALSALAAAGAMRASAVHAAGGPLRAVAFDGLALFDPRPVARLAESLFPGQGMALMNAWRTRQFEYTWLRNSLGRYADFLQVTEESLAFAAKAAKVPVDDAARAKLVGAFLELEAWPDVAPTIAALRAAGCRLAILSNFTPAMLERSIARSRLDGAFERVLSTDLARAYKPDPQAYRLALDAFRLPRSRIAFVAFAGWDVTGARSFGFPTYWVNRLGAPAETLGYEADATAPDLGGLAGFLEATAPGPRAGEPRA